VVKINTIQTTFRKKYT